MSITDRYLATVGDALSQVRDSQAEAIAAAVDACAGSIASDHLVFTFGTGHGAFAAMETFPRTGTVVGFRPIVETAITMFQPVLGHHGARQYRFLHGQEGYGHAILAAHRLRSDDTVVLFSHSGINPVVLDVATGCAQRGMIVIGVTSLPHSQRVASRHSSGRRLFEVADIVIDTGVPYADAGLRVDGCEHPLGPTSTVVGVAIAHAIVAGTAAELVARGHRPYVMVSPNTAGKQAANEQNDRNYEELWRRLSSR